MSLFHVSRDANAHGSAGSGDHVARRRALLSLVLTVRSTRSDYRPQPAGAVRTGSDPWDTT